MNLLTRKAVPVLAVTVLGLTAGGIAWAGSSSAPGATRTASAVDHGGHGGHGSGPDRPRGLGRHVLGRHVLGRHVLHGEVVLQTRNGFVTAVVARGTVTAVDAHSISVTSADGVTTTFAIGANTKARSAGKVVSIASVHNGDKVGVIGTKTGATVTARVIRERAG